MLVKLSTEDVQNLISALQVIAECTDIESARQIALECLSEVGQEE